MEPTSDARFRVTRHVRMCTRDGDLHRWCTLVAVLPDGTHSQVPCEGDVSTFVAAEGDRAYARAVADAKARADLAAENERLARHYAEVREKARPAEDALMKSQGWKVYTFAKDFGGYEARLYRVYLNKGDVVYGRKSYVRTDCLECCKGTSGCNTFNVYDAAESLLPCAE